MRFALNYYGGSGGTGGIGIRHTAAAAGIMHIFTIRIRIRIPFTALVTWIEDCDAPNECFQYTTVK